MHRIALCANKGDGAFYPLQYGDTPLHLAVLRITKYTCVGQLLSAPGIDVNIKNKVSWSRGVHVAVLIRGMAILPTPSTTRRCNDILHN